MNTRFLLLKYSATLLLDQLISLLASLILVTITSSLLKENGIFAANLIGVIFFIWMIYFDAWHKAAGDLNKIKLGYIKKSYFKGFLAGLVASVPNILLSVLAFLSTSGKVASGDVLGMDIFNMIFRFWNIPLGLFMETVNSNPFYNFLIPLFVPLFSGVGYVLGLHRISIKQHIVYKNSDK